MWIVQESGLCQITYGIPRLGLRKINQCYYLNYPLMQTNLKSDFHDRKKIFYDSINKNVSHLSTSTHSWVSHLIFHTFVKERERNHRAIVLYPLIDSGTLIREDSVQWSFISRRNVYSLKFWLIIVVCIISTSMKSDLFSKQFKN